MKFCRPFNLSIAVGAALCFSANIASATSLQYTLYIVDSQGNKVDGIKTQATVHGIAVPLVGEIDFNGVTMTVEDNRVRLTGDVHTCIGKDGCGSQYSTQKYSFNSLYGVPIGNGTGTLDATLTNQLANSSTNARLYGAQDNVGKITINDIDPILPEDYAQMTVSIKSNPSLGYGWGIFADENVGLDFVKVDGWLVLDRFLAANKFYVETRSGSGQFDFHIVGCLVGGSAGGICGGTPENPPPGGEVPEPMSMALLLSGLAAGARVKSRSN